MQLLLEFSTDHFETMRTCFILSVNMHVVCALILFGMCIDIMEIWYVIANVQISSLFDRVIWSPHSSGGVLLCHVLIVL